MSTAVAAKCVYDFSEGSRDMRELLGGKGANVAEMTRVLGAERVPAGLHDHHRGVRRLHGRRPRRARRASRSRSTRRSRASRSRRARSSATPTTRCWSRCARARASRCRACSTRSSTSGSTTSRSRASRAAHRATSASPGTPTAASCRCSATSCAASRASASRTRSRRSRTDRGVKDDTELDVDALRELVDALQGPLPRARPARTSRRTRASSCAQAIRAVFDSWIGERAVAYRRINRIPDDWGTAVNVQQMVFGNKGDTSGSGVAFCRDEVTGAPEPSGDFLPNAQGEDVVSGRAQHARHLRARGADARVARRADGDPAHARAPLQGHAGHRVHRRGGAPLHAPDAQRQAARPGGGALRGRRGGGGPAHARGGAAHDRRRRRSTRCCTRRFDPDADVTRCWPRAWRPRPARPRARSCSPPPRRSRRPADGRDVILVRPFTEADDVAGFHAAKGILTARGRQGLPRGARRARHGPAVRRRRVAARDRPRQPRRIAVGRRRRSSDGRPDRDRRHDRARHDRRRPARRARGRRELRARCSRGPTSSAASACAPTPTRPRTRAGRASSAPRASACAAPSTCSWPTDRQPKMRAMILADDERGAPRGARRAAAAPAGRLRGDLRGDGGPAGHDPAARPAAARVPARPRRARGAGRGARVEETDDLAELERTLERVRPLEETNPMLGTRGVPARDPLPRDLRDAGRGDHARGAGGARAHRRGAARSRS